MSSSTRSRPTSVSSSSLMQDVPGSFPNLSTQQEPDDYYVVEQQQHLSLSQAVHARRAEYLRPRQIRIKIGTWNIAAHKGTDKDVGGWFVDGRGVEKALAGLAVKEDDQSIPKESIGAQEARYDRKLPSLPKNESSALPGNDDVHLYVLGLQEVVDINSTTEALRPYTDPAVAKRWQEELSAALPPGYRLVAEQQLIGLLLLIYASPDIADEVKSVSTTSVGTGLMGYMGNKGAVTARLVIGDTTRLVFINCHLAAGADKTALERRNWDAAQILQRTRFEPIKDALDLSQSSGEQIGDEDFAFWMGDLNYRLQTIPGDDVRRLLMLHTRNEYDVQRQSTLKIDKEIDIATQAAKRVREHAGSVASADPSSSDSPRPSLDNASAASMSSDNRINIDDIDPNDDPASLQTTLSSLLPHDELHQQMRLRKGFHDGWREGAITFLPTYKYDVGSVGIFDSSEKRRAPSWCDRILYRTRRDKVAYDTAIKEEEAAKKRDEEMRLNGTDQAADDDEILYDYDPDADGTNYNDDFDEYDEQQDDTKGMTRTATKEGGDPDLRLEYYIAHQRVLSSDHKPLNAVFLLKYDSVVPNLKAKVHAEVAKELDKAENEGRPNVTVVVDQQNNKTLEQADESRAGFEGVDFGDVKWNQSKMRSLTVANTSRVPSSLSFIERPVASGHAAGIAPSWLTLKVNDIPLSSSASKSDAITLDPGETATVELEILIHDLDLVRQCNENKTSSLEDTLVLRVDNGRDHFIPVRAEWLPTSLGRAIDKLIRIPEGGIRKLQSQRPDGNKPCGAPEGSKSPSLPDPADGPVRFSAPRELFRLTEAIEELGTRVVAEWDMIVADEAETAPWSRHPGWPFEIDCWDTRETTEWRDALSEACNALDTDQSLLAPGVLPPEMTRMQQLYVLSSLLLTFLHSIPEGIIDDSLWEHLDNYLTQVEKSKSKPSEDEIRTAIQEILAQQPSHNISFILITTLLERLVQETAGSSQIPVAEAETSSPLSKKAGGALRRVTGTFSKAPAAPHRELACAALARMFAGVLFRTPSSQSGTKKPHAGLERRRVELVERFLRKDVPGL